MFTSLLLNYIIDSCCFLLQHGSFRSFERVTANIVNEQPRTMGGPQVLWIVPGCNNFSSYKTDSYESESKALDLNKIVVSILTRKVKGK
jgi:hypothetical protein